MLFRSHIAKHRATIPAGHRRADAAGDVVVTQFNLGKTFQIQLALKFSRTLSKLDNRNRPRAQSKLGSTADSFQRKDAEAQRIQWSLLRLCFQGFNKNHAPAAPRTDRKSVV